MPPPDTEPLRASSSSAFTCVEWASPHPSLYASDFTNAILSGGALQDVIAAFSERDEKQEGAWAGSLLPCEAMETQEHLAEDDPDPGPAASLPTMGSSDTTPDEEDQDSSTYQECFERLMEINKELGL